MAVYLRRCSFRSLWVLPVPWHECEQFAWAYIKSEFLYPKRLLFQSEDLYHACVEETLALGEKNQGGWRSPYEKKKNSGQKRNG